MSTKRGEALWIDMLPLDVLSQIAWLVSDGKQTRELLNLGMASVHQRPAVADALSYTYTTDEDTLRSGYDWADIFRNNIQTLDASYQLTIYELSLVSHYESIRALFLSPTLRELHLHATDRLITPFLRFPRLRNAVVWFKHASPSWVASNITLSLKTEEITYTCDHDGPCSLFQMGFLAEYYRLFKSVRLHCRCYNTGLWFLLRLVPKVDEISFATKPPPDILSRIKRISAIQFVSGSSTWDLIPQPADTVIEVGQTGLFRLMYGSHWVYCPDLRVLHCNLTFEPEGPSLLFRESFPSFRMKLSWDPSTPCFLCDFKSKKSTKGTKHYIKGAVTESTTHNSKDPEFDLHRLFVEFYGQIEILELLGNTLKFFFVYDMV